MVEYECARCGFCTHKASTYNNHTMRMRICKARDPSVDGIKPTTENVIRRARVAPAVAADPSPLQDSISLTVNNGVVNINIMAAPSDRSLLRFPRQDLSHLTSEQKRGILDTVRKAGFDEAVSAMLGTLYCNLKQPHNMNVVMEEGHAAEPEQTDPVTVTRVFGMHKRAPASWDTCDTVEALRLMLEEHGDAIRSFPEELNEVRGGTMVSNSIVEAVDKAYDAGDFAKNPELEKKLAEKMKDVRNIKNLLHALQPFNHLLMA
jgi:hypothetical protein